MEHLQASYNDNKARAERLRLAVVDQLSALLRTSDVTLGVPMESRVKEWKSIQEKVERKALALTNIEDLDDFIGIRTIFLFRRDLPIADALIKSKFSLDRCEDTGSRLNDSQFGYQSQHYILSIQDRWLELPTMAEFRGMRFELQIRTLAQHIWAAASHKLQYKSEESVPVPVRRSIYRVSALLEIVDLEFDRVLGDRQEYRRSVIDEGDASSSLNVDSLSKLLEKHFPPQNRGDEEPYASLLDNLKNLGVDSHTKLSEILEKHKAATLRAEAERLAKVEELGFYLGTTKERTEKGVFFGHVGLARQALRLEFGKDAVELAMQGERAE